MAAPKGLQEFINGPLSDKSGGNAGLRSRLKAIVEDNAADEEQHPATSRAFREILLHRTQPLFSYQREIIDTLDAARRSKRQAAALVSLPTGGGKTRTGVWFFREKLAAGEMTKLLWVAPSAELVEQAVETVRQLWADFLDGPEILVRVTDSVVQSQKRSGLAGQVFLRHLNSR